MQNTANHNATPKTKELLNYLSDIAGNHIITGQHTQTNPMEEISYIKKITGKQPKLRGFELLSYSPNKSHRINCITFGQTVPKRFIPYHLLSITFKEAFSKIDIRKQQ